MRGDRLVEQMEAHQVAVYLAAIGAGAVLGLVVPSMGSGLADAINPVLGVLLFVTFLQVPVSQLTRSLQSGRFLGSALVVDFLVVPVVVAAMFPFLPADRAVRLGVLLVLLCPCVDYVIVFSGLAGAANRQLLAITPVLLLVQMLLLPVFLLLFLGHGLAGVVRIGPFATSFVVLIVIPLALAWLVQAWPGRRPAGVAFGAAVSPAMVPLMAVTLFSVVGSQVPQVHHHLADVLRVVPFYIVFLLVMPLAGVLVGRMFRLETAPARAIVFTGATRNSLVVLPLALSMPPALAIGAVVVVTQTLVEVVGMLVYVRMVPRLLPEKIDQMITSPG